MTFLNASLIIGTLAAIVPIVLHLIAKREPKKVMFPSIRFLTKRFETNRSRMRLRRWWLLAMRILAVASLAVALARPTIHRSLSLTWLTISLAIVAAVVLLVLATLSWLKKKTETDNRSGTTSLSLLSVAAILLAAAIGWAGWTYATGPSPSLDTASPVAIAIVVDNGPALGWKTARDDRMMRAIDAAAAVISQLPRTSRISIVDRTSAPPAFSLDVSGALSKLDQLRPVALARPLESRLKAAARLLGTSEMENRQMVVITDLTQQHWDRERTGEEDRQPIEFDTEVGLNIFDLGDFDGVNRSLSLPKLSDGTPAKNVPVSISTILTSQVFGEADGNATVTAELQLYQTSAEFPVIRDGKVVYPQKTSVDRTTATISGNASAELVLNVPGLAIGNHLGLIQINGTDALDSDNQRYFTLSVLPPSSVLIVSDRVTEAAIIETTLQASAAEVPDEDAEFQVQRIGFNDVPVAALDQFQAIVLLDPPAETLSEDSLIQYVRSGGNVLACLGPNLTEQSDAMKGLDESDLLPRIIRPWRVPDEGTFFQVMRDQHPAVATLVGDTPWDQFPVSQYWQIEPSASDSVIVRYAGTGHPALIERTVVGQSGSATDDDGASAQAGNDSPLSDSAKSGSLMLLTTPIPAVDVPTRSWNRLFGTDPWPAWLLTRQSIEYLTRRGSSPLMTMIGTPVTLPLPATDEALPSRLQWFPPDDHPPIPVDVADAAGEITLSGIDQAGPNWVRGLPQSLRFAANDPHEKLNFQRLTKADLDNVFGADQYDLATSIDQINIADSQSATRVSLASPAMLLAFFVFLIEQILANRFYRRSR